MCGRFTLTVDSLALVAEQLGVVPTAEQLAAHRPRYNVAPGDRCWLVRQGDAGRELVDGAWGLVNHWARERSVGYRQINARAETLAERPAYSEAYRARRCVIPSDGFFEWRGPRGQREPLWIHRPDGGLLCFAGLYESWRDPQTDRWLRTFTIVTTEPNEVVQPIHDRMPAVIAADEVEAWLGGPDPGGFLRPAGVELVVTPASTRLNRPEQDDPDLLDPDDPREPKQMALF